MDKDGLIHMVKTVTVDRLKIEGICRLGRYIHDPKVMDLLCREAVGTENQAVIRALIDTVKADPEAAARRFSSFAVNAEKPDVRRRALTGLKAMECRRAKEAVLQGLNDPHPSVRIAAAANIPLYCDPDIAQALERFLECDRALLVFDLVCEAASPFLPKIDRMGRIYSENCHAGSVQAEKKRINGASPRFQYFSRPEDKKDSKHPKQVTRPDRRHTPQADTPPPSVGWTNGAGAASMPEAEIKRLYRFLRNPFPMQGTGRTPEGLPADQTAGM